MRSLLLFALLLFTACYSNAVADPTGQKRWQQEVDEGRERERIESGYYKSVRCPPSAQPEWGNASAAEKHRMQVDCRKLGEYADAGTVVR